MANLLDASARRRAGRQRRLGVQRAEDEARREQEPADYDAAVALLTDGYRSVEAFDEAGFCDRALAAARSGTP